MRSGPFGPLRLSSVRILICTRAVRGTLLEGFPRQLRGVDERSAAGDGGFRERGRGAGGGGQAHVSAAVSGLEGTLRRVLCLLDAFELLPGAPQARGAMCQGCRAERWVVKSRAECRLPRSQGDKDSVLQCWIKGQIQDDLDNFLFAGSLATSNLF